MRGGALFFYEDRPDGGKGCTAVRADDADAFYVDGGGPLGAPWEEVRRAIEGLGGDWVAWEEGIASFPLGMIVTAPSSPLRTSAFAYRAPELEAPGDAGAVPGAGDGSRRGAIRRRGDRPRRAGDRVRGAVRCLGARAARDRSPPRCAEALRRIAEVLGFREEAEALAGAAMALSGASGAGSSLSLARFG